MKTQIQYTIVTLLLLTALMGCGKKDQPTSTDEAIGTEQPNLVHITPDQARQAGLETAVPSMRRLAATLQAHGVLDVPPQNLVTISAPFGGYLQSTPLLQGAHVTKGQQIALLEDPAYVTLQQEYLEFLSQETYLKAELKRQEQLAAENVNARKALEKAQSDYEGIRARLAGTKARLEMLHIDLKSLEQGNIQKSAPIYAPISGYVTEVNANVGSHIAPEDAIFRIADTGHLHAELSVYERDLPNLSVGQRVEVRMSNETTWREASIHLIGREVGPDRSIKVHVHFAQEDPLLVPGTYVEARILALGHEALALPTEAIVSFEGKQYVFEAAGNESFQMRAVEIGLSDSAWTEVKFPTGTNLGAKFATKGAYDLLAMLKNQEE